MFIYVAHAFIILHFNGNVQHCAVPGCTVVSFNALFKQTVLNTCFPPIPAPPLKEETPTP